MTAISASLGQLDAHQDNISALRGEGAAKINRLELTASRFDAQKIATGDQLSKIEDADMAQAITDLSMRETVYNAGPRDGRPRHPEVAGGFPAMRARGHESQVSPRGSDEGSRDPSVPGDPPLRSIGMIGDHPHHVRL